LTEDKDEEKEGGPRGVIPLLFFSFLHRLDTPFCRRDAVKVEEKKGKRVWFLFTLIYTLTLHKDIGEAEETENCHQEGPSQSLCCCVRKI
jgi:hypothetical protein